MWYDFAPVIKCQFINTQTLIIPRAFLGEPVGGNSPSINVPNEAPYRQVSGGFLGRSVLFFMLTMITTQIPGKMISAKIGKMLMFVCVCVRTSQHTHGVCMYVRVLGVLFKVPINLTVILVLVMLIKTNTIKCEVVNMASVFNVAINNVMPRGQLEELMRCHRSFRPIRSHHRTLAKQRPWLRCTMLLGQHGM